MTQVLLLAGARSDFLKLAPVLRALRGAPDFAPRLIHAGRAEDLSPEFLAELEVSAPDRYLSVTGSDTAAAARLLIACESILLAEKPDLVLVIGDRDPAFAGALAAVKLRIPVAHVDAGLRSGRWSAPDELNRRLIDRISAWLLAPSPDAERNLIAEGHPPDRIHAVGNVLADSLLHLRSAIARSPVLDDLGSRPGWYAVLTLDRPETMAEPVPLAAALAAVTRVLAEIPIFCLTDPRTRHQLPAGLDGLRLLEPLGYADALRLIMDARFVLTDAGDIQEATSSFQVPCLTLGDHTERSLTVTAGTNRVVGLDPERIAVAIRTIGRGEDRFRSQSPPGWDGQAAERIVAVLRAGAPAWNLEEALRES